MIKPLKIPPQYTSWDDFDADAYAWTWYGEHITEIDRHLITGALNSLKQLKIQPESLRIVADIGPGPNLYPAMILAPLVKSRADGGQIDLIEYSAPCREYLTKAVQDTDNSRLAGIWNKYEDFMADISPRWQGALKRARQLANIIEGDIYKLTPETYDAISAFFVAESITDSLAECERAIQSLLLAIKPGGLVIVGHMINSQGYPAGVGTHFPGVAITVSDLKRFYKDKLTNVCIVEPPYKQQVQDAYHGATIVVGIKK